MPTREEIEQELADVRKSLAMIRTVHFGVKEARAMFKNAVVELEKVYKQIGKLESWNAVLHGELMSTLRNKEEENARKTEEG